jgi:hypothetical protein
MSLLVNPNVLLSHTHPIVVKTIRFHNISNFDTKKWQHHVDLILWFIMLGRLIFI